MDKSSNNKVYRFEKFSLDAGHLMLYRENEEIPLSPKAVETLCVLVEHRGEILSKDELMKSIWTDSIVEESNLSQYLHILRKTLGKRENGTPFIETLRRRGYRFSADVFVSEDLVFDDRAENYPDRRFSDHNNKEPQKALPRYQVDRTGNVLAVKEWNQPGSIADANGVDGAFPSREAPKLDDDLVPAAKSRRLIPVITLFGLFIFVIAGVYFWGKSETTGASSPIKSIAILPFRPVAESASNEMLQLGMTDALIARFSGSRQLTVRPLEAVRRYANSEDDAAEIGKALRVDATIVGNYQLDGDRVRVTLRLVQTSDGSVIWADKFDEKNTDAFALQDAVSSRLVKAIMPRLADAGSYALNDRGTGDEQALQLYQRGRHFWNQRTAAGYQKAIESFDMAISRDPDFAQAYSGLADSYMLLGGYNIAPLTPSETIEKAKAAANKALEINESLAEPHASLGLIAFNYDWDFSAAERHYKRAIELDPNYVTAHHWYADAFLVGLGHFDEAIAEMRKAHELDPLSSIINTDLGKSLFLARRYDEAVVQLQQTLELDPTFDLARMWLTLVLISKGDHALAMNEMKQTAQDDSFRNKILIAMINSSAGRKPEAKTDVDAMVKNADAKTLKAYGGWLVYAYAALGDKDRAFEWLEKEFQVRGSLMGGLKVVPMLDPLRDDPRFADLMSRVGFSEQK